MNPIHNFPSTSLRFIFILSSHLWLGLKTGRFLHAYWPKFWMHFSPVHVTCPTNLTLIIYHEEYNIWSSSLCNSSILRLHILLTTLFWNTVYLIKNLTTIVHKAVKAWFLNRSNIMQVRLSWPTKWTGWSRMAAKFGEKSHKTRI
jgi:hypothetical protein